MKRGKDDDKIMGPMFPRLHVNDTEKGGPRAPPRNKMALYEQLSVPSQRFNPGIVPVSNPATTNISVPPALSSQQGSIPEKHPVSPLRVTQSAPPHREERFLGCQPEGISLNAPPAPLEQRNKVGDEDDFTVAVFVNSLWGPCSLRTKNGVDKEKQMALKQAFSVQHKNGSSKETAQNSSSGTSLRKDLSRPNEESRHACSRGEHCKSASDLAARKKVGRASKDENKSDNKDCGKVSSSKVSRLHDMDACLRQEPNSANKGGDNRSINDVESVRCIDIRVFPQHETDACLEEPGSSPYEADNNTERFGDKADGEEQLGNIGKSDDDSETSMVDSVSGLDISPDDVVGIIGQKRFWKARRTIVNQQRVFAVQVFELHRLIKVQKLIAGSPELLLEGSAYLGKASFKTPLAKKFPPEYFVKPLPQIKGGEDSDKPSHLMDWPMENAVGKASFSSVQNGSQPSGYGSNNGALPSVPVGNDSNTSPWSFHNLPGHRWLIPVMSLSEGLVYKPYPGPGFMGNVCGECGPFGASMAGNYMTPAYGVPASHYQGIGAIPGAPLVGQTYFAPYGMPVTNPAHSVSTLDRIPGLNNSSGQFPGCGANLNMQHQSSGNLPSRKTVAVQHAKAPASKDTELRGSTASSPSERVQGDAADNATEGRNALQLFPIAPNVPEGAPQPNDADQPPKVIRVVPHNPRSATASAARIFQSIQEERKQYDSV